MYFIPKSLKRIVHRDIKPKNILKDKNNNYILSDFWLCSQNKN